MGVFNLTWLSATLVHGNSYKFWTKIEFNRLFEWWRHFTTKDRMLFSGLYCQANFSNCPFIPKLEDKFEWESILTKHSSLGSRITPSCKWLNPRYLVSHSNMAAVCLFRRVQHGFRDVMWKRSIVVTTSTVSEVNNGWLRKNNCVAGAAGALSFVM